ncbi:MAG: hypothetical protein MR029_09385 [Clostridium sp.]|nr:hypothetical protein [Clostridium sp.]
MSRIDLAEDKLVKYFDKMADGCPYPFYVYDVDKFEKCKRRVFPIDVDKLWNANEAYAHDIGSPSEVIMMVDTTLFESGKTGYLFLRDGFYAQYFWKKFGAEFIPYRDIQSVQFCREHKSGQDKGIEIVMKNGRVYSKEILEMQPEPTIKYIKEMMQSYK